MIKKIIFSFIAVFMIVSAAHASKMYVMDTPTTNILNYGSYDVSFRMFGYGGVHTRLDFGVFKFFNIGVSWELDRFIGNDQIEMAVPALSVKFRLYEGNMKWPGIALGFDGQGYFWNPDYDPDSDYLQRGKGLYVVIGRELFLEGLTFDLGVNMNNFSKPGVRGFINATIPLYVEVVQFMAEYDNIGYFPEARINAGLRFNLTDAIDLDFMMRDCWGKDSPDKVPNERVFKISYTGKF